MVLGAVFHGFFSRISFLTPYLIFAMLFVTYCRIAAREVRFTALHWVLLAFQLGGGILLYLLLAPVSGVLAQGAFMCSFIPTAMAATTIGGMLGANVATMASFCLLSNMGVAVAAPVMFALFGAHPEYSFLRSLMLILWRVVPLLILPFVCAVVLDRFLPRWHEAVKRRQTVSFWLWAVSLTIVMGRTVEFLVHQPRAEPLDNQHSVLCQPRLCGLRSRHSVRDGSSGRIRLQLHLFGRRGDVRALQLH